MSCAGWNCRGLGNPEAVRELGNFAKREAPALLFVMETKIRAKRVEDLRARLGFAGCFAIDSEGLSGGLGLFWSSDVIVDVKNKSSDHIDCVVQKVDLSSPPWRFTGFYGAPRAENRHHSWRFLRTLHGIQHDAWLVLGDFNETLYGSEHFSRSARPEWQMRAFREAVEDCGLQDLGWSGVPFTWDNRQTGEANVKARLDRALANYDFMQRFEYSRVRHVSFVESDHCFVMVEISETLESNQRRGLNPFVMKICGKCIQNMILLLERNGSRIMMARVYRVLSLHWASFRLSWAHGEVGSLGP